MLNGRTESLTFTLGNKMLEEMDGYNYLRQVVSADTNHEKEVRRRMCMGWGTFDKHSQINNSRLPL